MSNDQQNYDGTIGVWEYEGEHPDAPQYKGTIQINGVRYNISLWDNSEYVQQENPDAPILRGLIDEYKGGQRQQSNQDNNQGRGGYQQHPNQGGGPRRGAPPRASQGRGGPSRSNQGGGNSYRRGSRGGSNY